MQKIFGILIFVANLCFACNHSENLKSNFSIASQHCTDIQLTEGTIKSFEVYSMLRFDGLNGTNIITAINFPFHKESSFDRKYFRFEGDTATNDSTIVYFYKQISDQSDIQHISDLLDNKQLQQCKNDLSFKMCIVLTSTDMHQTYLFFDEERILHIGNVCYKVDKEMFKQIITLLPDDMQKTWAAGL